MKSYNRGNISNRPNPRIIYEDDGGVDFQNENDSWMIAYLDLMTLLLALFIMMGALSHAKAGISLQGKSEAVKKSEMTGKPITVDATIKRQGQNKGMEEDLRKVIGSNSLGGVMAVKSQPGLLRLQMDARLLFPVGKANMKLEGQQALKDVAELFKDNANAIDVEGHTDNVPMNSTQFQSNWSLSSARAVSVVEALIKLGIPASKLHATAYADTHPIASNATEQGRAKNRRVEFVIEMGPEYSRQRK
ncbi:MAG: OmpA family protein [Mariprofundaceae bacterium]|nr:OmpA family protein [Mariprofundaceae bacterium]